MKRAAADSEPLAAGRDCKATVRVVETVRVAVEYQGSQKDCHVSIETVRIPIETVRFDYYGSQRDWQGSRDYGYWSGEGY